MNKPYQMRMVHPHSATYEGKKANLQTILTEKHHHTFYLPGLLIPWFRFRMYIKFLAGKEPCIILDKTRYGYENNCTYKQCLAGHVKNILLDRIAGYNKLIEAIECGNFKNCLSATIYGRDDAGNFSLVHRHYHRGQLDTERINDPEIEVADQFKTLEYMVQNGRLVIIDPEKFQSGN